MQSKVIPSACILAGTLMHKFTLLPQHTERGGGWAGSRIGGRTSAGGVESGVGVPGGPRVGGLGVQGGQRRWGGLYNNYITTI